jgi:glucokinase
MILGIDIGGTTTKLGLISGGRVLERTRMATIGHNDAGSFVDALTREAKALADKSGAVVKAIGVGAPNGNQRTGRIEKAPNLPWGQDLPLAELLAKEFAVPCQLGNDANAAALGEWYHGAGRGCSDLLVVTLGTGLGSGLIVDGRLLLGPFGNAGELGHVILVPDGRACTCGRNGCLEAYVSIRGILQTHAEVTEDKLIANTDEGVKPIADAAYHGDKAALSTFDKTAAWLAIGLANAVAIAPPQRIVLCGGIAASGEVLFGPLRRHFAMDILSIHSGKVELVRSGLATDDAGLLGAAALVEHHREE